MKIEVGRTYKCPDGYVKVLENLNLNQSSDRMVMNNDLFVCIYYNENDFDQGVNGFSCCFWENGKPESKNPLVCRHEIEGILMGTEFTNALEDYLDSED